MRPEYNRAAPGPPKCRELMKVLVIEDDRETAAFIARALREAGATVDCAETGPDGLFLGSEGSYDVMVVDRLLPKMDGLGLVRVLRGAGVALRCFS